MNRHTRAITLAVRGLPTEFRLFTKGWNETENGRFLFDDAAATSVMNAYRKWGVDMMIDLEHQSLEVEPGGPDPTARDARGWYKLELRPDGSLWATDVRWTPDGARRLAEKTQRYVSPAFEIDPKTRRVNKILNAALVAMPATHHTPALVAASVRTVGAIRLTASERRAMAAVRCTPEGFATAKRVFGATTMADVKALFSRGQ